MATSPYYRVRKTCLEEHHVGRARAAGWTWAEIATVLEVSPQAVHKRHARRLPAESSHGTLGS